MSPPAAPISRDSIRCALEAKLDERGELHLDAESAQIILTWLRVLEQETNVTNRFVEELLAILKRVGLTPEPPTRD